MERYSEYKDSGVQWLGMIPGHWKTIRVKSLLSERIDKSDTGTEEPLSMSQKYGIIPTKDMDVIPNMASTYVGAKRVFKNDLVFNKLKAHLGVFAISKYDGLVSPDYAVYTPNERTYLPFMEYMFHTPLYIGEFTRKATGVAIGLTRLYTNGLFAIPFLYPSITEQRAIVSYLDDKCAKIDKMLEGKQKQIELLAEMKQRIIADAVTRGLDSDVKMKTTNIPWLPEIPEHWDLRKIKYVFEERSEKNHPNEPMLSATQTEGVILQSRYKGRVVIVTTGFEGLKLVRVGDFVIHLRSFQGGIEYAYDQGIISSAYTVLKPNYPEYSEYYKYLMKCVSFIDLLKTCVTGIREGQNINYSKLKKNFIPMPPVEEQRSIVSYITERSSKIDTLTQKLQQEIESIKEYKQRLISDVVTGQIKVC